MEGMQELVQYVYREKLDTSHFSPQESQLFHSIATGACKDDLDAQVSLYGSLNGRSTYRVVKKNLRERLTSTLWFANIRRERYSEYFVEKNRCYRQHYIVFVLFALGLGKSALALAEKVLGKALHYGLTDIALYNAKQLMRHHSNKGNRKNFLAARNVFQECSALQAAENEAEVILGDIFITFIQAAPAAPKEIDAMVKSLERLHALRAQFGSRQLTVHYYRAALVLAQARERHAEVVSLSGEALDYLKRNPHLAQNKLYFEFHNARLNSYLTVRDYNNARFSIKLLLKYVSTENQLWFQHQQRRFMLGMHTGNFNDAHLAVQSVLNSNQFSNQADVVCQQWKLYKAYVGYVELRQNYGNPRDERRKVDRLIDETRRSLQSNELWNTNFLIVRILFAVKWGDHEILEELFDSLRQQCSKYLYKNQAYRTQVFIRMLLLIQRENGRYERVEKLGRQWLRKLNSSTATIDEGEIIPFERLWNWLLTDLQTIVPQSNAYAYASDMPMFEEAGHAMM